MHLMFTVIYYAIDFNDVAFWRSDRRPIDSLVSIAQ